MNWHVIKQQREEIALESTLLMAGLIAMLSLVSIFLFGPQGLILGPLIPVVLYLVQAKAPISWLLKAHHARPLPTHHPLARIFKRLCQRAGLDHQVQLFYAPVRFLNAYTIGHGDDSAVVINTPILEYFSSQEVTGILAHELGHVMNKDVRYMAVVSVFASMVPHMAFVLLIVAVATLPVVVMQGAVIKLLAMLGTAIALPSLARYIQAKLSRNREFAADLGAAELLGSPEYLISALVKLERYAAESRLPWMQPRQDYYGSHPNTLDRVERLRSYREHRHLQLSGWTRRSA